MSNDRRPWTFDPPEGWDEMDSDERSAWFDRQRQLDQARRQYRAREADYDGAIAALADTIKAQAERAHRRLAASPLWRDD